MLSLLPLYLRLFRATFSPILEVTFAWNFTGGMMLLQWIRLIDYSLQALTRSVGLTSNVSLRRVMVLIITSVRHPTGLVSKEAWALSWEVTSPNGTSKPVLSTKQTRKVIEEACYLLYQFINLSVLDYITVQRRYLCPKSFSNCINVTNSPLWSRH